MRGTVAVAMVLLAAVLVPAPATAQEGSRQSAELLFDERAPGVPSGFGLRIDYAGALFAATVNPGNPAAKPPSVRRVIERFAEGARLDTTIPASCAADNLTLMLRGLAACPAGSRVGRGTITVDTGLPLGPARFLRTDVTFLNNRNELIFLVRERRTGLRLVFRSVVQEGRIVSSSPFLPGMLPDGAAIDVVEARFDRIARDVGGVERGYLTTPPSCPAGGAWENEIEFRYADGIVQSVTSESPCDGAGT